MCCKELLLNFFNAIREDPRIGPTHISLYAALLALWCKQQFQGVIKITSKSLMAQSKIYGCATYYGALKDLHAFGYIYYQPSFNHITGSSVQLINVDSSQEF